MEQQTLNIQGMSCQMCVKHVTKALSELDGVSAVDVSLENNNANVTYDPSVVGLAEFKVAVADAGYEVVA